MRFKRFSAMLLALAMCMGVFSTTVFAYSDERVQQPLLRKRQKPWKLSLIRPKIRLPRKFPTP